MTGTQHPEDEGAGRSWFTPQENQPPAASEPPYQGATWPASGEAWPPPPAPPQTHPAPPPAPPQTHPAPPAGQPGPEPASAPPPLRRPGRRAAPAPTGAPWLSGAPRTFSDQQVWPPSGPAHEQPEVSTQPFPAVQAPSLPRAMFAAPAAAAGPAAPQERPPPTAAGPAPRGRTALRAAAAVLALAAAIAVPTWDGYTTYRGARPPDQIHSHAVGETVPFRHVSWKIDVEQVDGMPGSRPPAADQQWLRIRATRISLDPEGVIRRNDPEFEVKDSGGQSWKAESLDNDLPAEAKDHQINTPYHYNVISLVPRALAARLEVCVRPSPARMIENESVEDMFKRAAKEKELSDNVLCFRR
ncbi:hypothetical protein FHR32_003612 [Streptosporangium album]|uniref:Uncharacterized protein n=1 Tax=Streptosporangium album TaxID=47479 RepID=A0A7W7RWP2_9ACTN|nr:hypothetical protein [Streptosporangium album]MBB4939307.1 hypothetical protein [Streptosporangium album]